MEGKGAGHELAIGAAVCWTAETKRGYVAFYLHGPENRLSQRNFFCAARAPSGGEATLSGFGKGLNGLQHAGHRMGTTAGEGTSKD
jgi:hypothetical protein